MLKNITLRDYQEQILNELRFVPSIGLFMKTGSGKTITSLARVEQNGTKNLLVICPQKIITQWWEVLEEHTDFKILNYNLRITAKVKNELIEYFISNNIASKKCIVINYEILDKVKSIDRFINEDWTIIVDESHKIKNMGTTRKPVIATKRCLELGERTPYKIILTATPTEKENGGYIDLYSQLRFLGYIDYTESYFKNNFCYISKLQLPGMPFPIPKIVGYKMEKI